MRSCRCRSRFNYAVAVANEHQGKRMRPARAFTLSQSSLCCALFHLHRLYVYVCIYLIDLCCCISLSHYMRLTPPPPPLLWHLDSKLARDITTRVALFFALYKRCKRTVTSLYMLLLSTVVESTAFPEFRDTSSKAILCKTLSLPREMNSFYGAQ